MRRVFAKLVEKKRTGLVWVEQRTEGENLKTMSLDTSFREMRVRRNRGRVLLVKGKMGE